jgi:hypothetical protein
LHVFSINRVKLVARTPTVTDNKGQREYVIAYFNSWSKSYILETLTGVRKLVQVIRRIHEEYWCRWQFVSLHGTKILFISKFVSSRKEFCLHIPSSQLDFASNIVYLYSLCLEIHVSRRSIIWDRTCSRATQPSVIGSSCALRSGAFCPCVVCFSRCLTS